MNPFDFLDLTRINEFMNSKYPPLTLITVMSFCLVILGIGVCHDGPRERMTRSDWLVQYGFGTIISGAGLWFLFMFGLPLAVSGAVLSIGMLIFASGILRSVITEENVTMKGNTMIRIFFSFVSVLCIIMAIGLLPFCYYLDFEHKKGE
jgi:hypothetical protein